MNQIYHIHLLPIKEITSKSYPKEPFKALSDMKEKKNEFCYENSREKFPRENKRDIFVIKTLKAGEREER